ncbi:MAG: glycosyltransferase family 2 protein [candidate division WOR-3 bacterium]
MTQPQPFVSVIIPCRNEEGLIRMCLDSILFQDYSKENMEVIVVDGMSEDKTREIVEEYTKKYHFIKLLDNPKKTTPCALNTGIKNARGEIIIRMDAHATYHPEYITRCVQYLTGVADGRRQAEFSEFRIPNSEFLCVGGIWRVMPRENTLQNKAILFATSSIFAAGDAYYRRGYAGKPKWVDTVFGGCYKRTVFEKIGLFNENLLRAQDLEFNIRLKKAGGKILLVPEIIACYYPKAKLTQFFKHNFQDGFWTIFAFKFTRTPFKLRHYLPLLLVISLLLLWVFGFKFWLLAWGLYLLLSLYFSCIIAIKNNDIRLFFIMPIAFGARHFGYGLGSIWGLIRLLSLKPEN